MSTAIRATKVARAIRDHALKTHAALTPKVHKAEVKQLAPIIVDLLDADLLLEDGDQLVLGGWLRLYNHVYKVAVGDTLFLYPMSDGDWLAFDIATQNDMAEGLGVLSTDRAVSTDHGDVVATVPFADADGATVGVALLYDPTTLRDSPDA